VVALEGRGVSTEGSQLVSRQVRNNGAGAASNPNSQVRITDSSAAGREYAYGNPILTIHIQLVCLGSGTL
jgi:hypothetical protein